MDFIIDNWTDIYIEILIQQNEQFRYVAENISKLKEKMPCLTTPKNQVRLMLIYIIMNIQDYLSLLL